MRGIALAVALVATLTACNGTQGAPRPLPGARPPQVTVYARNLPLFPDGARAIRLGLQPAGDDVFVRSDFSSESVRAHLCPLTSVDAPLPRLDTCRRFVRSGVREPVGTPGLGGIALVLEGGDGVTVDLTIQFDERGRDLSVRLPHVPPMGAAAACADNACNPFFEVQPVRSGAFRSEATWSGPNATLALLQGGVLGRSQTATGHPYRRPAQDEGRSPLRTATTLGAPAEYALAFIQGPGRATTSLAIESSWP